MIDETHNPPYPTEPQASEPTAADRIGFCQDCGQPLTRATVRAVPSGSNAGVYCEPCLGVRMATPSVPNGAPAAGPVTGVSHPVLAALLGFIPGVGAMYNGQYAKGFAHLIVFAVLVSFKDGVYDLFGWLVAGWIFYMVFDAYQTARAYRDGLPLPNPFHLNEIGERFGFGKNPTPSWQSTPASAYDPTATTPYPPPAAPAAASWTGYVPPTPPGSVPPVATSQGWGSVPPPPVVAGYTQGAPVWAAPTASTMPPDVYADAIPPRSRIPVAAIWLIGLGVLILLANLLPSFHIEGRWITPVILAAVSIFSFLQSYRRHTSLYCALRFPVILMVLALLFTLQAADIATLGRTWPVIVIALGIVLLLERTLGSPAIPPVGYIPSHPLAPTPHDDTKGGL